MNHKLGTFHRVYIVKTSLLFLVQYSFPKVLDRLFRSVPDSFTQRLLGTLVDGTHQQLQHLDQGLFLLGLVSFSLARLLLTLRQLVDPHIQHVVPQAVHDLPLPGAQRPLFKHGDLGLDASPVRHRVIRTVVADDELGSVATQLERLPDHEADEQQHLVDAVAVDAVPLARDRLPERRGVRDQPRILILIGTRIRINVVFLGHDGKGRRQRGGEVLHGNHVFGIVHV